MLVDGTGTQTATAGKGNVHLAETAKQSTHIVIGTAQLADYVECSRTILYAGCIYSYGVGI